MFADDTKLIGKIMDIATKSLLGLQDDILNVIAWALKNNMQVQSATYLGTPGYYVHKH